MASVAREVTAYDERAASCSSGSTWRARSTRGSCSGCSACRSRSRSAGAARRRGPASAARWRCRRRSATCAPRCSGRSGTPRARPPSRSPRSSSGCAGCTPISRSCCEEGASEEVPRNLEALAQSVLVGGGAQRAQARRRRAGGRLAAQRRGHVRARGAQRRRPAATTAAGVGSGLRLATLEALQHGGVLEYGESEPGRLAGAPRGAHRPVTGTRCTSSAPTAEDDLDPRAERAAAAARAGRRRPRRRALGLSADARPAAVGASAAVSARTGAEALAVCRRYEPHVALVDLFLGGESGPGDVRAPACRGAGAARAADVGRRRHLAARRARGAGAAGFISKDWPAQRDRQARAHGRRRRRRCSASRQPGAPALTDRESEILGLIAGGATNREIAGTLLPLARTPSRSTRARCTASSAPATARTPSSAPSAWACTAEAAPDHPPSGGFAPRCGRAAPAHGRTGRRRR